MRKAFLFWLCIGVSLICLQFAEPLHRGYLTRHVNDFFRRIPLFSRSLQWRKTKKVAIADDFSFLVAGE